MSWIIYVILFLITAVTFNQTYKVITKKMQNPGALTVLMELLSGSVSLLLIPFFEIKLPENPMVYVFLGLACIFYALNDRISIVARKGLEASTYSMIKQTSTVLMIFAGVLFFKEKFILNKIIGALLIVFSNILVFYKKGSLKSNKYALIGLLASLCNTIALFIDVNYSKQMNLPLYAGFTLLIPALIIILFERISPKKIIAEFNANDKKMIIISCIAQGLMMVFKLRAYQLGQVSIVAPLCTLTIMLNVIIGYFFLKERNNLLKKIVAATIIILGIVLIKL